MSGHNRYFRPWTLRWSRTGHAMLRSQTNHVSHSCMDPTTRNRPDGSSWGNVIVCAFSQHGNVFPRMFSPIHPVSTGSINWINLNAELVELVIPRSLFFFQVMMTQFWHQAEAPSDQSCQGKIEIQLLFFLSTSFCVQNCWHLQQVKCYWLQLRYFHQELNLSIHFHSFVSLGKIRLSSSLCLKIRNLEAFSQMWKPNVSMCQQDLTCFYISRVFVFVINIVPLRFSFVLCTRTTTAWLHVLRYLSIQDQGCHIWLGSKFPDISLTIPWHVTIYPWQFILFIQVRNKDCPLKQLKIRYIYIKCFRQKAII